MVDQFETASSSMRRMLLVVFQTSPEHVDRIMAAVTEIVPLAIGNYDGNSYQSASGVESYRPREGAASGAEPELRKRSGMVEISFEIEDDRLLAEKVVEAIFQVHSYEEPVIRLQSILSSRSKGLDDRSNPNRWWNATGDWKNAAKDVE